VVRLQGCQRPVDEAVVSRLAVYNITIFIVLVVLLLLAMWLNAQHPVSVPLP
jgi:hypothetical protein